jgi:hypothetical protein
LWSAFSLLSPLNLWCVRGQCLPLQFALSLPNALVLWCANPIPPVHFLRRFAFCPLSPLFARRSLSLVERLLRPCSLQEDSPEGWILLRSRTLRRRTLVTVLVAISRLRAGSVARDVGISPRSNSDALFSCRESCMAHSRRQKPSCAAEHCSERTPTKRMRTQRCWDVAWRAEVLCVSFR